MMNENMSRKFVKEDPLDILPLARELCAFRSGVVADDNEPLFARLCEELPFTLRRYATGEIHNGWVVPQNWHVHKAEISRDGVILYDGTVHALGVGMYSRSFEGELDWEELEPHLVTNPNVPDAHVFHSMWQIRSWAADWALCVPYEVYERMGPGRYRIDLVTSYEPGEMIVAEYEKKGRSDDIIIFNTNTCHPTQANDGFAAGALLVRLFQWLSEQDTHYTYRLILAPEHLGSVFYMRDKSREEIARIQSCIFAEMPGNIGNLTVARTFLGEQTLDHAFRNVVRHYSRGYKLAGWREGCGNDETVWEAPGHEVPTVEFTRAADPNYPYREYHSSGDNPDLMDHDMLVEFHDALRRVVEILESNVVLHRHFDGLICLSHPDYDLYFERHDPAIDKELTEDDGKWGHLLDSLLRYFDGSMTVLDIAERHELPYFELFTYLRRFEARGLISFEFAPVRRPPLSARR
jgi:aminopeptidase-like protein